MIIKLSLTGGPPKPDLSQFTGNANNTFAGCEFRVNDSSREADAWFVVEDVDPSDDECVVPPNQVHFLSAESSWSPDKYLAPDREKFLRQFSSVNSCHPVRLGSQNFSAPFLPWMINANHDNILSPHHRDLHFFRGMDMPSKDRPLSVFCSTQTSTPSHRLRLAFVEHLKHELGEDLEWFGNGVNQVDEKWAGLERFERTLVLENRSDRGIYTEKILDAYLGLSAPIYWGAPDIHKYFPIPTAHQLNIFDFRESTKQIRRLLKTRVSDAETENLMKGKHLVLNELHFLNRIARIAKERSFENGSRRTVRLQPRGSFVNPESGSKSGKQKAADFIYRRLFRPFERRI